MPFGFFPAYRASTTTLSVSFLCGLIATPQHHPVVRTFHEGEIRHTTDALREQRSNVAYSSA
jgi:hypothetical protein